jgi:hypothetical protein
MSCFISEGISLGCADGIGGLKKLYVLGGSTGATFGTVAYNVDDAITGATGGSGSFYAFELKRNTSDLTQNVMKSFENGTIYFEQVVNASFYRYDADKRNALKILSQNDEIYIIGIDQNDTQYLLGQTNGMYLSGGNAGTGTALGDKNGFTLTFTGQEPVPARVINGTLATVFSGNTFVG